jgi:DNA-binding response OmpR family regulator
MADLLLVDNDARLTELMAWFLRKRGHEVRIALSYAAARLCIAEREPELMLADLELGSERGRDELPRMHRDHGLPRTVVVSGYLDRETEELLGELTPVVATLRKPFDLDHLEQTIDACVRSARTPFDASAAERASDRGDVPRESSSIARASIIATHEHAATNARDAGRHTQT